MKYAVEQKYFDNGRVVAKVLKCDDYEESFSEERTTYDYYFEVFNTLEDAEEVYHECLEA